MKDYYLLVGLNSKEIKILGVNQNNDGLIEVAIESKKNKVRCPICNKFTSSVHDKLNPIRSVYLDSCGSKVDLIICKKRYHCYNCNKIFTEKLNINVDKGNVSNNNKLPKLLKRIKFEYKDFIFLRGRILKLICLRVIRKVWL